MQNKKPGPKPDRQPNRRQAIPADNPFLEKLFAFLCRNVSALPNEDFVGLANRWTEALDLTAALQPRTQKEWVQAVEVTIWHFAAAHSLFMHRQPGLSARQRARHDREFRRHVDATRDARLLYDQIRNMEAG